MKKTLISLVMTVFAMSAFASNSSFDKRFELVRNDQKEVIAVKMKMFSQNFKLRPYLEQVKNDLVSEINRMRSKSSYDYELEDFIDSLEIGNEKGLDEDSLILRDSIKGLRKLNVNKIFKKMAEKGVLKKFELDMQKVLLNFDLSVIANVNDSKFFYKRNVTYEVVQRALNFAKKKFGQVPVLNVASFIIVKVHDLIVDQRIFHQNLLLHYLSTMDEKNLGMTRFEADRVFSSIYESKISWMNFRESKRAQSQWAKYGLDKFYAMVRMANNKVRRATQAYDKVNKRYNWAFVEVIEKGQRVVKNLIDNQHQFSRKSATAYYYDSPTKIKRIRSLLSLGQLGLGFLPIPSAIKSRVNTFIESFYVEQTRTEGSLIGYFESQEDSEMVEKIYSQNQNPYIIK